jgi:hypothetical protein
MIFFGVPVLFGDLFAEALSLNAAESRFNDGTVTPPMMVLLMKSLLFTLRIVILLTLDLKKLDQPGNDRTAIYQF